ncbi:MAG: NAD(P)/FAD-dependent oxidoreductase [Candidatus Merdivicinus sp.]|jgi:NAD(P)H-nitrite reductase large subunit
MNYVIIGNSAAAVGCVEGIRSRDREGSVTMITDEPYHTYSRPLISYLLCGKTDEERMKYRSDSFYEDNRVTLLAGKRAVKIDAASKTVLLDSGEAVPYDKLLAATGSRPFVPPVKGLDQVENAFTFMTLDSARALEKALGPDKRVLILGAGLIGLKCAEGIADKAGSLTVVDLANHILPSILDSEGAALVQKHIEDHGISFILGDGVESFDGNTAVLKSGKIVPFDVLAICVGVRPNTELISGAGGEVARGVCVSSACETTLPDIYAAGDCTESFDVSCGKNRILALLPNAYMQGECAGVNMAGGEKSYEHAIPMNAIGFFGYHVLTAGSYTGEVYSSSAGNSLKKLFYEDDRLKGFLLIGDVARAGIYTNLIRSETPLSSIDFGLICEKPQLMAFSRAERKEMLS